MFGRYRLSLLLAVMLPLATATCQGARPHALIGNRAADLSKLSNADLINTTLVPLRETARILGAEVRWNKSSQTATIRKASRSASMRIGRHRGIINGASVYFPYPPTIYGGDTYAPFFLFNQMYGSVLYWDPYFQNFRMIIIPGSPNVQSTLPTIYGPAYYYGAPQQEVVPSQPTASNRYVPSTNTAIGEIIRVYASGSQATITVLVNGSSVMYGVPNDVIILRGPTSGQSVEVPIGSVRPGDRVTIRFDNQGRIASIRAQYREVSGTVRGIAKKTLLLITGDTLIITPETEVVLTGNVTGDIQDIHAGDTISARVSPLSGKAYMIKVTTGAAATHSANPPPPEQLTLSTRRVLREGDKLVIRFRAEPGGEARYTIPGLVTDLPMEETKQGLYEARFRVQTGDVAIKQKVIVKFKSPTGTSYAKESDALVTIQTIAGYLPRITSPGQGDEIASPLVVTGVANPGDTVRVEIDYRADVGNILPIDGIADTQDVVADENGHWSTSPLSAVAPSNEYRWNPSLNLGPLIGPGFRMRHEPAIVYTVIAALIGADGTPKSVYRIEVTKGPGKVVEGFTPPLVESKQRPSG